MNKIIDYIKSKSIACIISAAVALVALISDIVYIAAVGTDKSFSILAFVFVLLAAIVCVAEFVTGFEFVSLIAAFLFAAAIGFHFYPGFQTLSDIWNGVNFIGGNASAVIAFGIIFAICTVASIVVCFMKKAKK